MWRSVEHTVQELHLASFFFIPIPLPGAYGTCIDSLFARALCPCSSPAACLRVASTALAAELQIPRYLEPLRFMVRGFCGETHLEHVWCKLLLLAVTLTFIGVCAGKQDATEQ